MAFGEWYPDFVDLYEGTPGISAVEPGDESDYMEDLFERGFMHHSAEPGYDADDAAAAREEFFDYLGLEYEDFDWDGWREAMGYE